MAENQDKPVNKDVPNPEQKEIKGGETRKKWWRIKSKDGAGLLNFFPVFEVNEKDGLVECRFLEMEFDDEKGKKKTFKFDWLNIYMFIYYTCNEELRRGLAMRYERKITMIPYDIEVKITEAEKQAGFLRRRVELPVDELQMAIARDEAWRLLRGAVKKNNLDPSQFMYKGRKKL